MSRVDYNPALTALTTIIACTDHVESQARELLGRMNRISSQFEDVSALLNEFNIRAKLDEEGLSYTDFEDSDFREIFDRCYDQGILKTEDGKRTYKFESKKEIQLFRAKLEGKQTHLKNKNQEPLLLLQALLNRIESMNKTGKAFTDQDEKLKEKANNIR